MEASRGEVVVVNGAKFWSLSEEERSSLRKSVAYVHDKLIFGKGIREVQLRAGLEA